jgi:hypothetical protein
LTFALKYALIKTLQGVEELIFSLEIAVQKLLYCILKASVLVVLTGWRITLKCNCKLVCYGDDLKGKGSAQNCKNY